MDTSTSTCTQRARCRGTCTCHVPRSRARVRGGGRVRARGRTRSQKPKQDRLQVAVDGTSGALRSPPPPPRRYNSTMLSVVLACLISAPAPWVPDLKDPRQKMLGAMAEELERAHKSLQLRGHEP